MGGADPPYEPLPGCVPPPKRVSPSLPREFHGDGLPESPLWGQAQKGNPSGGVSGVVPPQMAPLILGLLGFAGECFLVALVPILTDLYRLSWEIYS